MEDEKSEDRRQKSEFRRPSPRPSPGVPGEGEKGEIFEE